MAKRLTWTRRTGGENQEKHRTEVTEVTEGGMRVGGAKLVAGTWRPGLAALSPPCNVNPRKFSFGQIHANDLLAVTSWARTWREAPGSGGASPYLRRGSSLELSLLSWPYAG
jgi:hypothetical protein